MSSSQKLKDIIGSGTNRYNLVRLDARKQCRNNHRLEKCERCGYDKHVEVCHINAINSFDMESLMSEINAKDNLIVLCPNCHWEMDNLNKPNLIICPLCYGQKWRTSKHCRKCTNTHKLHIQTRKVVWPTKDELTQLINQLPLTHIGKRYGVSDNSVKKWCKRYGIILGNRSGFWAKKRCKQNQLN